MHAYHNVAHSASHVCACDRMCTVCAVSPDSSAPETCNGVSYMGTCSKKLTVAIADRSDGAASDCVLSKARVFKS